MLYTYAQITAWWQKQVGCDFDWIIEPQIMFCVRTQVNGLGGISKQDVADLSQHGPKVVSCEKVRLCL